MNVELQRKLTPDSMPLVENCGICAETFEPESVLAFATTDERYGIGWLCPECVEYLGRRVPGRYPSIEEYQEAKRLYPEPVWANEEEAMRAERDEEFDYEDTFVWRVS